MFNIVLVEPETPPNTGNIGRLCLATDATLHLVGPLGFSIDDRSLKRAGLDYWKEVKVKIWDDWQHFSSVHPISERHFLLTSKTNKPYWETSFQPNDFIIFGPETRGLDEKLLTSHPEKTRTIPMPSGKTRSLNLATSAGIVLYEALKQNVTKNF